MNCLCVGHNIIVYTLLEGVWPYDLFAHNLCSNWPSTFAGPNLTGNANVLRKQGFYLRAFLTNQIKVREVLDSRLKVDIKI